MLLIFRILVVSKSETIIANKPWRLLYVTRASPGQYSEAAHPACRKRRLLGTHQLQSALVVGLPVGSLHPRLVRNGLPLFPWPNSIMLMA